MLGLVLRVSGQTYKCAPLGPLESRFASHSSDVVAQEGSADNGTETGGLSAPQSSLELGVPVKFFGVSQYTS